MPLAMVCVVCYVVTDFKCFNVKFYVNASVGW